MPPLLAAGAAVLSLAPALAQTPGAVLTRVNTLPLSQGRITGLIRGHDGNFHGTTRDAALGGGTIFKRSPDGTLTALYRLTGANGGALDAMFQGTDEQLPRTVKSTLAPGAGYMVGTATSAKVNILAR